MIRFSLGRVRQIQAVSWGLFASGLAGGIVLVLASHHAIEYTSDDRFCNEFCHVHPQATQLWIRSTHFSNKSGVVTHCVDCHLPAKPSSERYLEKTRLGVQDAYGILFKNVSAMDWQSRRTVERARAFTFDSGCVRCHANLFSIGLSKKGTDAHLHYQRFSSRLRCINCHLNVGHYSGSKSSEVITSESSQEVTDDAAFPLNPTGFGNYTEVLPGSGVKFHMVAIAGGSFYMGSPASEPLRRPDEGPVRRVRLSSFWMGQAEVSWREFDTYYAQRGRRDRQTHVDAVTGPTPPYGTPDQGWGRATRPAITMTHHAATEYCRWLSELTGRTYRLPTEAEWEYACRSGTTSPYFFVGNPARFSARSWVNTIFGVETHPLEEYAKYRMTSQDRTHPPTDVKANPYGLMHMLGNVRELCLDWYDPNAYTIGTPGVEVVNPKGPATGREHVVRGGSFKSDAADLRSAARDQTREEAWLLTDPQSPKSIWWYSDCNDVGFRVVRESEEQIHFRNELTLK